MVRDALGTALDRLRQGGSCNGNHGGQQLVGRVRRGEEASWPGIRAETRRASSRVLVPTSPVAAGL